MGLPAAKLILDEFIVWENAQPERHEFFRGEVFEIVMTHEDSDPRSRPIRG